ncbi:MAG: LysR family transcriptional regulator [Opitutaceae bacterium]|nr:LysR family transcriptional regulator [Opitutaceae bacterium]
MEKSSSFPRSRAEFSGMELYQLRTFVMVAEEGILSRAAERLFTSQSAVSAQIKALEEEFGLKLFERTPGGMVLTAAGEALSDQAERLLTASRHLSLQAAALKGTVSGNLRLGLNNPARLLRSHEIVSRLARQHPELRFELSYGSSGAVLQGLASRDLDAAFFEGSCENPEIGAVTLTHFDVVVVVPRAWAADLERPDWSRLRARPWVFVSPLCSYYRLLDQLCQREGISLQARFQVEEDQTAIEFVAEEMAIGVMSMAQLESSPLRDRVAVWPHFCHKMPLSLGYLRARAEEPMLRALLEAARSVWAGADTPVAR